MGVAPGDAELEAAVSAVCAGDVDRWEDDVAGIVRAIRDDHFMWTVDAARVERIVAARQGARLPAREVPDELFEVDWASARPWARGVAAPLRAGDIGPVTVAGVHHAQGGLGSLGVFLVQLQDEGFVVLKQQSQDAPGEVFASHLFAGLDIGCPQMRPLAADELALLTSKLRNAPVSVKGTCDEIHGSRFQDAGAVLIEFVTGKDLEAAPMDAAALAQALAPADLERLGAIIVADVVVNNADRIPTIWRSEEGNPANLLVDAQRPPGFRVTAIDQTVHPILNDARLGDYLARVADLFSPAVAARIEKFFRLSDQDAAPLVQQVLKGADAAIATLKQDGPALVQAALLKTRESGFQDFDRDGDVEAFVHKTIQALPEPRLHSGEGFLDYVATLCPLL